MKVDIIDTSYGEVIVEYSTFTKGFFVKDYPEKLKQISGLKFLTGRDNSVKTYQELKDRVMELVDKASIDFVFNRKVIIYEITKSSEEDYSPFSDGGSPYIKVFYMVANEGKRVFKNRAGKEDIQYEYIVLDGSNKKQIGKRDILGQIYYLGNAKRTIIDYDERLHKFLENLNTKLQQLVDNLDEFLAEDKVMQNVLQYGSQYPMLSN